tara:strand:- start:105 stop:308 length:204 start_codon:yes stop_codon:yes gene_type:complete
MNQSGGEVIQVQSFLEQSKYSMTQSFASKSTKKKITSDLITSDINQLESTAVSLHNNKCEIQIPDSS